MAGTEFSRLSPKAHFLGVKSNRKISLLPIVCPVCDTISSKKGLCKCPFCGSLPMSGVSFMADNVMLSLVDFLTISPFSLSRAAAEAAPLCTEKVEIPESCWEQRDLIAAQPDRGCICSVVPASPARRAPALGRFISASFLLHWLNWFFAS